MSDCLFHIVQTPNNGTLTAQADDLLRQIEMLHQQEKSRGRELFQMRIYVTDAANQCEVLRSHPLVVRFAPLGVVSFIEQPPLGGGKVAVLLWYFEGKMEGRAVENTPEGTCLTLRMDGLAYILHTVRFGAEAAALSAEEQTRKAFETHIALLQSRGMNLKDHCQRTWIYVRDVDRNYAGVVKARNEVFAREGLTADSHFIASTGIGGSTEHREALVAIDFFSVEGLPQERVSYLEALEFLNPTHEYGVAFERATRVDLPGHSLYLVSGTASIDAKGECVHRGDVICQTGRLLMNIDKLLASSGSSLRDVRYFLVYLRDVADYPAVRDYMRLRFPHTPSLITLGRVCRPEWLIEMECMAAKPY